mmetsp:Transcript_21741/g.45302  ORF Transcript_21741/g.45302 Transcript_21741/m.45302 type:complete len:244 (-) Transcript_21741:136-867(-)
MVVGDPLGDPDGGLPSVVRGKVHHPDLGWIGDCQGLTAVTLLGACSVVTKGGGKLSHHFDGAPGSVTTLEGDERNGSDVNKGAITVWALPWHSVLSEPSCTCALSNRNALVVHHSKKGLEQSVRLLHLRNVADELALDELLACVLICEVSFEILGLPRVSPLLHYHPGILPAIPVHWPHGALLPLHRRGLGKTKVAVLAVCSMGNERRTIHSSSWAHTDCSAHVIKNFPMNTNGIHGQGKNGG